MPKDVLLGGTPYALNNVPLFAKRQAIFSLDFISSDSGLTRAALSAYYADDVRKVIDFCRAYGVDYLVIDEHTYSPEFLAEYKVFYEPYHQELAPQLARQETFALAHVADQSKVFESGDFYVAPCDERLQVTTAQRH